MKKTIGLIGIFLLAFGFSSAITLAQTSDVGFFEAMDNLQKLENLRNQQVLTGEMDLEGMGKGNFELIVQSVTDRGESDVPKVKSMLNGKVHVSVEDESYPFKNLEVGFKLGLISIENKDLYVRLDNAELKAEGVPEADREAYLNFRSTMGDELSKIRGKWIHIPNDSLKGGVSAKAGEFGDLVNPEAVQQDLEKEGLKKTLDKWLSAFVDDAQKSGKLTAEDAAKALKAKDRVLATQFFSLKTRKGNVVQFQLSRQAIMDLAKGLASDLGQPVTNGSLDALAVMLSKIQLSGNYHVDEALRIFDHLKLRISLHDVGMVKRGMLQIENRVGGVGKVPAISAPAKFMELGDTGLPIPPVDQPTLDQTMIDQPIEEPLPAIQ